jgi:hypothetical protein
LNARSADAERSLGTASCIRMTPAE